MILWTKSQTEQCVWEETADIGFGISWGLTHTILRVAASIRPQQYRFETVIRLCSRARADSRRDSAELIAFTHHQPPCKQSTCNGNNTELRCVSDKVTVRASVTERWKVFVHVMWGVCGSEVDCVCACVCVAVCFVMEYAWVHMCKCVCVLAREECDTSRRLSFTYPLISADSQVR